MNWHTQCRVIRSDDSVLFRDFDMDCTPEGHQKQFTFARDNYDRVVAKLSMPRANTNNNWNNKTYNVAADRLAASRPAKWKQRVCSIAAWRALNLSVSMKCSGMLTRPENLTENQAAKLKQLLHYNLKSVRSHLMKEDFQRFWEYSSPSWAGKFLDQWCARAMRSKLEPMKKMARTLRNKRDLILNWFRADGRISAGISKA